MIDSATQMWLRTLDILVNRGTKIDPRGMLTHEVLSYQSRIDMNYPIVNVAARRLGFAFMFAEAAWILSGDNRVSTITKYSKEIARFSDDGVFFFGSYGPKVRDQLQYVVKCLSNDLASRQAVINIWREHPPGTRDVPCTLSYQFIIRNDTLHVGATMRSSDIWLGWPYDVFNMSMVARAVAILLKDQMRELQLKLGTLCLTAGSQHLYERNFEAARQLVNDPEVLEEDPRVSECSRSPVGEWDSYREFDCFVDTLWMCAEHYYETK